jgi:hypothetical protein
MSRPDVDPRTAGRANRASPGKVVVGVLLVLVGLAWLIDSVGLVRVPWQTVLPAALLVVGIALLVTVRRPTAGGLVGLGIVLSVLVLITSGLTFPLSGSVTGAGDVQQRPTSVEAAEEGFALAVGSLTVDLRDLPLREGEITVEAGVGIGELIVLVPADVTVEVRARSGMGEVRVDDRSQGGVGTEVRERLEGDGPATILLDVSVGMGKVEVRR